MIVDDAEQPNTPAEARSLWIRLLPVFVVLLLLVLGYVSGYHRYFSLEHIVAHRDRLLGIVDNHGTFAAITYFVLYIVAVAISFPGASILTIAGGLMFCWMLTGTMTVVAAAYGTNFMPNRAGARFTSQNGNSGMKRIDKR